MPGERRKRMQLLDELLDPRVAFEGRPCPGRWKIPPVGKLPGGSTQAIDRTILPWLRAGERKRIRSAESPAHAFGRIRQLRLEPCAKRLLEETGGLRVRQHAEQRIDARFDGALAQQLRAESMDVLTCASSRLPRALLAAGGRRRRQIPRAHARALRAASASVPLPPFP